MKVNNQIDLGNGHVIEIGQSTWDESITSVRNLYQNSNGNSPGSGEIPIDDLGSILKAVAECDLLDVADTVQLIEILAASLSRRTSFPTSLQTLLEKVTEDNIHTELDTGTAIGKESW